MLKVTKVMQEYVSKSLSVKTREAMRKFNNHVEIASTNFPKGLIIAGALASSMLQACTVKEKDFGDDIIIDDSVSRVFMKKVDDTLSDLGIIIAPKKSLEDVKSIYFKSSEGEYYFLEPKIISEKEIFIRQIKYNEDLSKEEYSLSIKQNNRSVDLEVVQNDHKEDYQILFEDGKIYILNKVDDIWVEFSRFDKGMGESLVQTFVNGKSKIFDDIKNDVEIPEDLIFEPPTEYEDVVVFG